ncbi:MAG: antitoxin [Methyloprofundus sp.]|nr:MAG: antitoxin [Methyloprofundus sp.]
MATLLIDQIDDQSFTQLDKMALNSGESTTEFARFLLAASMYHAHAISFQAAAELSGLGFNTFKKQLRENFSTGFIIASETIGEDLHMAKKLSNQT